MHLELMMDADVLTFGLTFADDSRTMLEDALAIDLRSHEALVASPLDGVDTRQLVAAEIIVLDALRAGDADVSFPVDSAEGLQSLVAACAIDAIGDARRDDARVWHGLWSQFPTRTGLV